jgi:hypothetical protein
MDEIGVFSPEQARTLWQDYLTRRQLQPQTQANYPQRRPIDEPSPHRVFVRNDSAETCPAYGCLQITGVAVVGGMTVITIDKPSTLTGEYLFNSPYPIAAGGNGWAYRYGIVIALGDGTAPTAVNVEYQPVVSTWTIEEAAGGFFTVFGEHNVATDAVIGRFDGGTLNVQHGIVTANLGCGYYTIEKGTWAGDMQDAGIGLGSDYTGSADCDICQDVVGAGTDACGITLTYAPCQVNGTGVYVTAYDEASALIPLVVGTSVKMINMGDVDTYTQTPIWQILRGVMEHVVKYEEDGECCPSTGVWQTTRKRANILIGKTCDWIECDPCYGG